MFFASWLCLNINIPTKYETAIFTAYTLSKEETDDNPEIGAGGHNLKDMCQKGRRCCASRLYPLHTKINIEGIGECEILDRTSIKYGERIDILMNSKEEAIKFGKRELKYCLVN